ncbi:MAG TPA: hypothetical protein V6D12_17260 [Candidatus Obscuribacterales bacterium]
MRSNLRAALRRSLTIGAELICVSPASMKSHLFCGHPGSVHSSVQPKLDEHWPTFEEMLQRLHRKGIYIHPDQLAEFLLAHGLPVHLRYVPAHLRQKAILVNENYQGDMACLVEEIDQPSWDFSWYF